MNPINQELYNQLTECFIKAIEKMQETIKKDGYHRTKRIVLPDEDGSFSFSFDFDYFYIIFKNPELLGSIHELDVVIKLMLADEEIRKAHKFIDDDNKPVEPSDNTLISTFKFDIVKLLTYYLKRNGLQFNVDKFNELFFEFEKKMIHHSSLNKTYLLLFNFNSIKPRIELTSNMTLRKVMREDIVDLWEDRHINGLNEKLLSFDHWWILEILTEDGHSTSTSEVILDNVVLALRLFKSGNFRIFSLCRRDVHNFVDVTSGRCCNNHSPFLKNPFELAEDEANSFIDFNNCLSPLINHYYSRDGPIDIAMRRLNLVYERGELEDKLVDILIGLEALFSPSFENLQFKISQRLAKIFKSTRNDREEIAKEIKNEIYTNRSKVVHGERVDASKLEKVVPLSEYYLRESIKLFMFIFNKIKNKYSGKQAHLEIISMIDCEDKELFSSIEELKRNNILNIEQ